MTPVWFPRQFEASCLMLWLYQYQKRACWSSVPGLAMNAMQGGTPPYVSCCRDLSPVTHHILFSTRSFWMRPSRITALKCTCTLQETHYMTADVLPPFFLFLKVLIVMMVLLQTLIKNKRKKTVQNGRSRGLPLVHMTQHANGGGDDGDFPYTWTKSRMQHCVSKKRAQTWIPSIISIVHNTTVPIVTRQINDKAYYYCVVLYSNHTVYCPPRGNPGTSK